MIRFGAILFSALIALTACTDVSTSTYGGNAASGDISRFNSGTIRLRHLDSLNALRTEHGAAPLQLSAELNAAAETHARDMAAQQRAWNFGSDRTSPQERATRAGFPGIVRGENVAETFKSELLVLQTWLESPSSRAAILDPQSTHMGYGWYQEPNGKVWWVEILAQGAMPMVTALSQ